MNHQDDASVTEGPFSKDPGLGFRYRRRRLRPGQTVLPGEAGLMLTGQQTMTLPAGSCRPPFPATNTRFYHVATDALPNEPDIGEKDWTTIDSTGAQGTVLMTGDLRSGAFGTGPPQDVGCVSSPFTRIKDQGLAKNSMGARTVARMAAFDMVRRAGRDGDLLAVRAALAPLNAARAGRLPTSARRYHDRITANTMPTVRFSLGKLHVTPGAVTALARTGTDPATPPRPPPARRLGTCRHRRGPRQQRRRGLRGAPPLHLRP
jgi:hypothetical protein